MIYGITFESATMYSFINTVYEPALFLILSADVTSKKSQRRGAVRREQHSVSFKAEVIYEKESRMTQDAIAGKYKINRSMVLKWVKK